MKINLRSMALSTLLVAFSVVAVRVGDDSAGLPKDDYVSAVQSVFNMNDVESASALSRYTRAAMNRELENTQPVMSHDVLAPIIKAPIITE